MHTQEAHQQTVGEWGKPKLQLARGQRGQRGGLRRVEWEGLQDLTLWGRYDAIIQCLVVACVLTLSRDAVVACFSYHTPQ